MKGLILAGGIGRRLRPVTDDKPKCLIEIGEKTLIEHLCDNFSYAEFEELVIVAGFKHEKVIEKVGNNWKGMKISYSVAHDYATTNTMHGLWSARDKIDGPFVQCHGDLLLHKEILKKVKESKLEDAVVVRKYDGEGDPDSNKVRMDKDRVIDINKSIKYTESASDAFGIYKFSDDSRKQYYNHIEDLLSGDPMTPFEVPFRKVLSQKYFQLIDVGNLPFFEIDSLADLAVARLASKLLH